jgi:hypothetical protein
MPILLLFGRIAFAVRFGLHVRTDGGRMDAASTDTPSRKVVNYQLYQMGGRTWTQEFGSHFLDVRQSVMFGKRIGKVIFARPIVY